MTATAQQLIDQWHDKVDALRAEVARRRRAYPRQVAAGAMAQADADRSIAVMELVLEDYTFWLKAHPGGIAYARTVAADRAAPGATTEHQGAML